MAQAPQQQQKQKERKPRKQRFSENTPPSEKFRIIASERVSRAINALAKVGNIKIKDYTPSNEQREKINKALTDALGTAVGKLASGGKAQTIFTL